MRADAKWPDRKLAMVRVGVTEQYLSMVFNGKRESSVIFGKIENAINEIIAEQKKKAKGEQHGTAAN